LRRRCEVASLESYQKKLEAKIYTLLKLIEDEHRPRTKEEVAVIEANQSILVKVWTIFIDLDIKPVSSLRSCLEEKQQPLVGLVEIAWRDKVQRTCFALPFSMKYLTFDTKQKFMDEVDLSTADKRMYELVDQTDAFSAEMDIIFERADKSFWYKFLFDNLSDIKLMNYGLVVILNLNILLSTAILESPYSVINDLIQGHDSHLSKSEQDSLLITSILGFIIAVGYVVIIATLAVTEIPLLVQQLDAAHEENGGEYPSFGELIKIWTPSVFGLCVSLIFIGLHSLNSSVSSYYLYGFIVFLFNVPLSLRASRQSIGENLSFKPFRYFAIIYDALNERVFLKHHIFLTSSCVLVMCVMIYTYIYVCACV
jgi:hypothetical protein